MKPATPDRAQYSGERFQVIYALARCADEREARTRARDICVEQTVEFPAELVPAGLVRDHVFGRLEGLEAVADGRWHARISFAVESAGAELTQLLNVVFGNVSLQPGVRVERLELPDVILRGLPGPRFGRAGLRALCDAPERPLLCTALKPMGLSPTQLADLAYQLALGGVDLVKDDHGLADQRFCPFRERVARCAEAVHRANAETGGRTLYLPNVSGDADRLLRRADFARGAGAGGLLVAPGLVGFDAMRGLAADDTLDLPILSHPAMQGSFCVDPDHGISHYALFGQLHRLAGADTIIFPNYGGRFSFSPAECRALTAGVCAPMGPIEPALPAPAGGMTLARVPEMLSFYGRDVVLLIGGDLHRQGDLVGACRRFRALVD